VNRLSPNLARGAVRRS